jgi:murein DD-endopeptidase MepM/ murein hydrolase activator NlpD
VHFFPRARRRRLYAALVALALAIGLVPLWRASATTDEDLADRRDRVRNSIKQAAEDLEGSSQEARDAVLRLRSAQAQLADARVQLAKAQAKLAEAERRDAQMKARLKTAEARLQTAQEELAAGRLALEQQRVAVAQLVSSIYTAGNPEILALSALMRSRTAADLTRQTKAREVVVGNETGAYEDLAVAEQALTAKEAEVAAIATEVAARRREAAKQLKTMQKLEAAAESAANEVAGLVTAREAARVAAAKAVAADREKLRELRAEEERIKRILRRRAAAAAAAAAAAGSSSGPVDSGGFLAYPVSGRISSPFGYRRHPIYGYWGLHDGIDFATGCGSPIYASANGVVLGSYYHSAYGNRLLVDHGFARGVGLATIYNHATRYVVGRGTNVRRGQLIGYVGSTGWSTGCHLHFTVMVNGNPVDPMKWF